MKFIGNKSSDAEIILDLKKGNVFFDYSLNKFGRDTDSNCSCLLQDERQLKLKIIDASLKPLYTLPLMFIASLLLSPLTHKLHIPQLFAQKNGKKIISFIYGIGEQQIIGNQDNKQIKFHIGDNIWFEYELDGDYQDKIEKLELRRSFIKKIFWTGSCFQQQGWDIILKFTEPPKYGYAIIRSLL